MDSNETEEFVFTDWAMPKDLKTEFMGEILKITMTLQYFFQFTERNIFKSKFPSDTIVGFLQEGLRPHIQLLLDENIKNDHSYNIDVLNTLPSLLLSATDYFREYLLIGHHLNNPPTAEEKYQRLSKDILNVASIIINSPGCRCFKRELQAEEAEKKQGQEKECKKRKPDV